MEMDKRRSPRLSPLVNQRLAVRQRRGQAKDAGGLGTEEVRETSIWSPKHACTWYVSINVSISFGFLQNSETSRLRGDPRKCWEGSGEWSREGEEADEKCLIRQVTVGENWSSVMLVTSGKQCGTCLSLAPPKGWGIFVLHLHVSSAEICSLEY